jgi:hypothetical protein
MYSEQDELMSEFETKIEAEVEDFSEELSDEALDRERGVRSCLSLLSWKGVPVADR